MQKSSEEMFLIRALDKITAEKDIKKSQHTQLRKACETALEHLKKNNALINDKQVEITDKVNDSDDANNKSTVLPPLKSEHGVLLEDQTYLLPFELACKSKSPKIVITALDCLQKLIAYGHVPNDMRNASDEKRLIERIVEVICSCFQGVQTDEGIQLQVIKALLTVMTSPLVEIHEGDVLSVVRTCYNIYLASRSTVNQTTARGTLTQMLNVIFQRMEQQTLDEAVAHTNHSTAASQPANIHRIEEEPNEEVEQEQHRARDESDESVVNDVVEYLMLQVEKSSLSISTSELSSPLDQSSEGHTPVSVDINSLEGNSSGQNSLGVFAHISQKDAFLVFRSLCRLSMKPLPEGAPDPKSHELRSKVLSLQLLLSILQNPGPVFKQSEMFITAIKQYLCVALSKNGVSSVPEVFELSLAIFLSLLSSFKQHLKMQIEVFFKEIFLYILETPSSSFEHKSNVIEALKRICSDAQCVVDIYLNYDCDFSLSNIFERLVTDLAKIAQGRQALELNAAPVQVRSLRQRGLECLVLILKCMVEWASELYVNPDVSANLGAEQQRCTALRGKSNADSGYVEGTGSLASRSSSQSSLVGSQTPTVNSQSSHPEILDNPEQFESRKQLKELFENGIALFAKKPLKGIRFLQTHNLIGKNVEDVAEFLHKEDRIDRNAIGEFLGENDKYNIEVMYAYIDQLDFAKSEFVSALRTFLAGFRLPGEAQKIDRLMEKFASRYCECNPGNELFASADTAYVLAFSIIMLTTDLHSSQIKQNHRMTKEEYIRMNRGINDRDDLPEAYLAKIYDEIAGNEIKIKETSARKPPPSKQTSVTSEKERKILFYKEMEQTAEAAKSLMESVSTIQSEFTSATHYDHIRPMFKIVWTPFLAAFSVGLQDCDDSEISQYCLEGVRYAIRISCIFHMELERDAYVQALCRFTLLTATAQLTEMKTKNVETIKTLVTVAHTDGNYLGRSWLDVLRCISQLESAQLIGSSTGTNKRTPGGHHDAAGSLARHFMPNNANHTRDRSGSILAGSSSISEIHPEDLRKISVLQEAMGETGSQSLVVAVDKIFTASYKLDGEAIVDFVRALCQVSREELSLGQPRMFSLQKVVEISYYNMGRIRLQWSRIWEILGEHFNSAGRSTNEDVAVFAVDSLRQLSMKFIEKGEFPNFHFQKEFLRPFLSILEDRPNLTVKIQDMVVRCISQMVNTHWANIRSGWTNIFGVFHKVASYDEESIVEIAFQTSAFVVQEVFNTHFHIVVESFQGLVKALAEFACNTHFPDISMEAIRLIRNCAHYVADRAQNFRDFQDTDSSVTEDDRVWVKGWMPVLCELFRVIHSCKLDVRTRGLTVFFEIVKTYGGQFKPRWWQETFNVIFRVFLHMRNDQSESSGGSNAPAMMDKGPSDRTEWMTTTCNHTLYAIVDVFTQYYTVLYDVLLDDLYGQLRWCCLQEHEQLARSGTSCLENVINCNGHRFTPEIWHRTVNLLVDIFTSSVPHRLLTWKPSQLDETVESNPPLESNRSGRRPSNSSLSSLSKGKSYRESNAQIFSGLLIKCVVQFELIQTIDHIVFYPATSKKEDQENWRKAGLLINNIPDFTTPFGDIERDFVCENNSNSSGSRRDHPESDNHATNPRESSSDVVDPSLTSYTNSLSEDCPDVFHHQGLYRYLSPEQLISLIDCLLQSHKFAKEFNSNHEQRNLLWKAGFKGKAKPNLLKQETQSLACALRILFKLSVDPRLNEDKDTRLKLESLLISVCTDALVYFKHVAAESHREAWSSVIVLLLTRLIFLPGADSRFKLYAKSLYPHLTDLIVISPLPTEIRALIRGFFIRCGQTFGMLSPDCETLSVSEQSSNHHPMT